MSTSTTQVRQLNDAEREAFRTARLVAYHQCPYYASGLFSLLPVASPGLKTFAVDKFWRLYMDPELLVGDSAWDAGTAGAVLLHEMGHLLRVHADRAATLPQPYNHTAWNLAGDAEINDDLLDAGVALPEGVVTPQALGCAPHDCAETYYASLMATAPPPPAPGQGAQGAPSGGQPGSGAPAGGQAGDGSGQQSPRGGAGGGVGSLLDDDGPGCGSGAGTAPVPGELPAAQEVDGHAGIDEATGGLIRRRIAEAVREEAAKSRGTVPGGVQRWADEVLAPATVPWNRVLRSVVRRALADVAGRTQFTYTRPSRRSGGGIIFPSMRGPRLRVAIVVDTSGSMSPSDLKAALSEVKGVLKSAGLGGDRVTVLTCDAASGKAQRVRRAEDVILTGGGGTDMRVGIAAAESVAPQANVVLTLTDGWTPWPDKPTKARLVCVIIGDQGDDRSTPDWALTVKVPSGAGR
jgi:predicted metal-dependent peptidase